MRVFVTGASGFIGKAVVEELVGAGHEVTGLARSDASAKAVEALGAKVLRGDLNDVESLKRGAAAADGVIHLAFIHDFAKIAASAGVDKVAIAAIGDALAGSGKPFVVTSATGLLTSGKIATEETIADGGAAGGYRAGSERVALDLAKRDVRVSVVRLPPTVHGEGDPQFVPALIGVARKQGVSAYVGDGANRWPAVHRRDAAQLFRLALEKGAPGSVFHAIDDDGVPTREIAEAIGKGLALPVASTSAAQAADHFGWIAKFFANDNPATSVRTRAQLGWKPRHANLRDDLKSGHYFEVR